MAFLFKKNFFRLLVSGLACKELRNCHSVLKSSEKLNKLYLDISLGFPENSTNRLSVCLYIYLSKGLYCKGSAHAVIKVEKSQDVQAQEN